jgi:tripartite-type tricarboxylate transporter receptor subunit TctC
LRRRKPTECGFAVTLERANVGAIKTVAIGRMEMAGIFRGCALALVGMLAFATGSSSHAQDAYPSKPVRIVVGFAAGGGNDIFARIIAAELQNALGGTFVVENKPGAGGRIAADYVKDQAADGTTLLVGASGAMAISPAISDKLHYNTTRDFVPISMMAQFPLLMVVNVDHPAKNVKDFVAWAKTNPDKSNYGTSSPAFTLAVELFKLKSGAPIQAIPYKSGNEMVLGVLGGQSSMTIVDPPPAVVQIRAGKVRGLAVTAAKRHDEVPDVPTLAEAGFPGIDVSLWSGLFAPAATPKPILVKLEAAMRKIMQLPEVKQKFKTNGAEVVGNSSQEFTARIENEIKMWKGVAQQANLKLE